MKKILATIVILCISAGVAYADSKLLSSNSVSVHYDDIDGYMKKNNLTIRSNDLTLQALKDNDSTGVLQNAISDSIWSLSSLRSRLQELALTATDPAVATSLTATSVLFEMNIQELKQQSAQLSIPQSTIDKTEIQLNQVEEQLIWGAKSLYFTYLSLQNQLEELTNSYNSLSNNTTVLKKRLELGQITEIEYKKAEYNLRVLESSLKTLRYEQQNLKSEINLLLGRTFNSELKIISPDYNYDKYIKNINADEDYKVALEANFSLILKKREVASKGPGSSSSQSLLMEYEAAQLQYTYEKNKFDAAFNKLYSDIFEKQRLLALEENSYQLKLEGLTIARRKYDIGNISRLELDAEQDALDSQNRKVISARQNLMLAVEKYKLSMEGIIVQ